MVLTPLEPQTFRSHTYCIRSHYRKIIQTFVNLKHALLYESHRPYSRDIHCILRSRRHATIDERQATPGQRAGVSTKEIYLFTLNALRDNWIVTSAIEGFWNTRPSRLASPPPDSRPPSPPASGEGPIADVIRPDHSL